MPSQRDTFSLLIVSALVCLVSFAVVGPFNMRIDGQIYTAQVEQFESGVLVHEPLDVALRAFKPFPGVWGALFVPLLSPVVALQLLNLCFLLLLPLVTYAFLREWNFSARNAWWGAVWVVTGYPVLKYGLAISTDIGSWVASIASAALILRGLRTDTIRPIIPASFIGFIGGTIKETGVIGLVFGGLAIMTTLRMLPWKRTVHYLLALVLPAALLELTLLTVLFVQGFPTFLDWYALNDSGYAHLVGERILRAVGVFMSTFGVLLFFSLVGVWSLVRNRTDWRRTYGPYVCAAAVAVSLVFLWPIAISRVFFIQILAVLPLAILGVMHLENTFQLARSRLFQVALRMAPVLISVLLFALSGAGSLFEVFRAL